MAVSTFLRPFLRVLLLLLLIFGILQLSTRTPRPYQVATPHISPARALLYEITSPAKAYFLLPDCDCTESKPVAPNCKVFPDGSVCTSYECQVLSNLNKKCETLAPFPPGDICSGCTRSRNVGCTSCVGGSCP